MSYTGTTTIAAGVLQVGQGGTEGSIGSGEIINNATLAINKGNDFTLSNNISGAGTFDQIGAGTTLLTGTSTLRGRDQRERRHPAGRGGQHLLAEQHAQCPERRDNRSCNSLDQTIGCRCPAPAR